MGRLQAEGMAGKMPLEFAVGWHLRYNHYPPPPQSMVAPCIAAIEAANGGDWEALIELPDGVSYRGAAAAPVHAIVEQHHLDPWIVEEV